MSKERIYKTGTPFKDMFDGDQVLRIPVVVKEVSDGQTTYARFHTLIRAADIPENGRRAFFEEEIKKAFQSRLSSMGTFADIDNFEFSELL